MGHRVQDAHLDARSDRLLDCHYRHSPVLARQEQVWLSLPDVSGTCPGHVPDQRCASAGLLAAMRSMVRGMVVEVVLAMHASALALYSRVGCGLAKRSSTQRVASHALQNDTLMSFRSSRVTLLGGRTS